MVTVASSALTSVFTCPSDRTAILKEVVISQTAGSAPTSVWLYLDSGPTTVQVGRWDFSTNDLPDRRERWLVLEEGDELLLAQSSARTIDYWMSGTLLQGDPS